MIEMDSDYLLAMAHQRIDSLEEENTRLQEKMNELIHSYNASMQVTDKLVAAVNSLQSCYITLTGELLNGK